MKEFSETKQCAYIVLLSIHAQKAETHSLKLLIHLLPFQSLKFCMRKISNVTDRCVGKPHDVRFTELKFIISIFWSQRACHLKTSKTSEGMFDLVSRYMGYILHIGSVTKTMFRNRATLPDIKESNSMIATKWRGHDYQRPCCQYRDDFETLSLHKDHLKHILLHFVGGTGLPEAFHKMTLFFFVMLIWRTYAQNNGVYKWQCALFFRLFPFQ